MEINEAGMKILEDSEGLYLKAYKDPVGIWTIGIGTIVYPSGLKVQKGDTCTKEQAEAWLQWELKTKAATLDHWVQYNKLSLTGNQCSALLSFAYNCGCGPIIEHGRSLNMAILSGNRGAIREAFGLYVKGTKKILGISYRVTLSGLVKRRKLEADLYLS